MAIPILIVLAALGGEGAHYGNQQSWAFGGGAGGLLFLAPLLMILFRQKYPRWWFDWNLELLRFQNRVGVYLALMDDRYPSTDERQSVQLDLPYPDAERDLNRWLPLVKWLLAIPHFIVLVFLWLAAVVAVDHRVVRDPLHRPLPARALRLRGRRAPLGQSRRRVRVHPRHRRVPAVQVERRELVETPSSRAQLAARAASARPTSRASSLLLEPLARLGGVLVVALAVQDEVFDRL